jgi:arylsulfatase A-like enzyme
MMSHSPLPNLVLVHCHDLGQHLGCYGVRTARTPHLDAFAASGVQFTRSFCTAPSCSPSRASLFTGRYPHSNGVMGLCHAGFAWDLNPDERHLAQLLAEAGYATAAVGVLHETRSGHRRCGYQRYAPASHAREAADAAVAWLAESARDHRRPFFLSVGFLEPHRLPYPSTDGQPPGSLPGDHGFPGPHLPADDALGVQVPGYLRDTEGARAELAGLQGAVRHVDEQFGRILAALRGQGLEHNTLVVFTADHGVAMPRAKCSLYEPGVGVALLLRLPARPGWSGGLQLDPLVSNVDLLPTLLDLLGVPAPGGLQGRSFAPLLDGRPWAPRDAVFTEMTYHDYYDPRRAVRTDRRKLIVNFSAAPAFMDPSQRWRPLADPVVPANRATAYHPDLELYDLASDPWEQVDLADRPEWASARAELLARLRRHLAETGDPILDGAITSPQHLRALALLQN